MVNPEYSGHTNPGFLTQADNFGIRYVDGDSSHTGATTVPYNSATPPDYNNPTPNAGQYDSFVSCRPGPDPDHPAPSGEPLLQRHEQY